MIFLRYDVVVIGGGPAGMMATAKAAQKKKEVILLEKNDRLGRKLMITGKGRCNITNNTNIEAMLDNIPVNSNFLYSAFYTFSNRQLIDLLENLGLKTKVERGQRVFPLSDDASDVVATLHRYVKDSGAEIRKAEVEEIKKKNDFFIIFSQGNRFKAKKVIIATGGCSYPATGSTGDGYKFARKFGHEIKPIHPSLVPIEVKEEWIKKAQGLSLKNVALSIYDQDNNKLYSEFGDMLITHFGLSGPIILSASSHLRELKGKNYRLLIDLKPALSYEKLDHRLQRDFKKYANKYFSNSLFDLLPRKIIPIIVGQSSIPYNKRVNQITGQEREKLVKLLKNIELHTKRYRPLKEAIVTSGGVDVDEIDPSTMESRLVTGLYFAGEVINVDGYTGGFNLQIAFSTGYLAGISC